MSKNLLVLLTALTLTSVASAQDYPYDDYVPELRKKKEYDPTYKLPVERPQNLRSDIDTVFGVNLQGGATFSLLQDETQTIERTTSGPGYAIAVGFGWDMLNHPISIELETGYQQNLMGTQSKFSAVPLKFSTYYWTKLSPDSVFRIGLGTSLDVRMQSSTLTTDSYWAIMPGWHFSMIYEYLSITLEPTLQIMRLRGGDSFLVGAFYLGYRI